MSRYSSSGLSSYSSYRSPYLDSSSTSFSSSSYALPSYESKFESLISRVDGKARSRAGTSTKYDYLSSFSSKYDYPSTYNSSTSSSTYGGRDYGTSSNYGSSNNYVSSLNADDLTRSYFEKYYNKSAASEVLSKPDDSYSRASRALSVYLDDASSTSGYATSDANNRNSRSTSVFGDISGTSRFARLLSQDENGDSGGSSLSSRRHSIAPKSYTDREKTEEPSYERTNGYSRYLDRDKDDEKQSEATSSYSRSNGYSRFLNRDNDDSSSSKLNGYSRFSSRDTAGDEYGSSSSNRRYSLYGDDSSSVYKRDYTRTYGGRTDSKDESDSRFSLSSSYQNGYDKDTTDNGRGSSGTSGGSTSGTGTGGTGGLKNLGNTCFMNSVIQCLSNTKLLVDYLLSDSYTQDINTTNSSMKGSLIKAFSTLIKGLWKPGSRVIDPSSLKGAVQRFAPRFSGYNQEDSQEFLRYLLEGLHEDVNRVTVKPQPINTEIDSNLSVQDQGMEAWKRYLRRDDSKLVDIFVGQLKSTLRCSTCDYESVTFEPFWDLSLPIPSRSGEVSLTECMEAFTKEEVLDGDEMPTCARCKTRRRCTKFFSLYKLPKVLVVHLKRFSPTERFRSKLSSTVTFPLTSLDVSRFSDSPGRSTYSCYAVSNHSGTLYSGHYTAYAKNPRTCEWHYFNDSRVSKSSSSSVISNEAYLLFFELLT